MAEPAAGSSAAAGAGGSEPAAAPPLPSEGLEEAVSAGEGPGPAEEAAGRPRGRHRDGVSPQRCPGGARAESRGAAADPGPAEEEAGAERFQKPAASKENVPSPAAPRRRSHETPDLRKSPLGPSPKRSSPWRGSPRKEPSLNSFNLSPRQLTASPQAKRRSWCRSSLKMTKRRKSLPPVHQDITELSKSISLELPETERLSVLLLSSFQFSAQKLEHVLQQSDSFNPEAFRAHACSLSEDLKRYMQKLKRDGTLKSCVADPNGSKPLEPLQGTARSPRMAPTLSLGFRVLLDSALDESVAQVKEYMASFTAECQAWDQLLQRYQESAEETSRQLEQSRSGGGGGRAEPLGQLQTSQSHVLGSKPDYQRILDEQGQVLRGMELVLDELQQAVKLLQVFSEDSQRFLRSLSEQLAKRTFRQLENSPVRKLIAAPPRREPPPEGPGGAGGGGPRSGQ